MTKLHSNQTVRRGVKRHCDEFDLNSNGVKVTHLCPYCDARLKCSMHQSEDVEEYTHVCDHCKKEWKQYTQEDLDQQREVEKQIGTTQVTLRRKSNE